MKHTNCVALEKIATRTLGRLFDLQDLWMIRPDSHNEGRPWLFVDYDPFKRRYEKCQREEHRWRLYAGALARPNLNFMVLTAFPHHTWFVSPWKEDHTWPSNVAVGVRPNLGGSFAKALRRLSQCRASHIFWYLPYDGTEIKDYSGYLEEWLRQYPERKPWIIIDKQISGGEADGAINRLVRMAGEKQCLLWVHGDKLVGVADQKQTPVLGGKAVPPPYVKQEAERDRWRMEHGPKMGIS